MPRGYDSERRDTLVQLRSPKRWPIWPALVVHNVERDSDESNAIGVILDPPHLVIKGTKKVRGTERESTWLRRTVFHMTEQQLPPKVELVRLLMMIELVNFAEIPHETYEDFDAMYAAGWRVGEPEEEQWRNPPEQKYGVFLWHEDPRYKLSEAVKTFNRESAAERYAAQLNQMYQGESRGWVVRDLKYAY